MNNKNLETNIGVQTEDQKNKPSKPLGKSYFYRGGAITDWDLSFCLLLFYIPL